MSLKESNTALLLIDFQKGFDDHEYWGGNRNNPDAEQKAKIVLNKWRELSLPIFHIVHSSKDPNSRLHESHPGFAIKDEVSPLADEPVIKKNVNSAFIGTDLEDRLNNLKIKQLVILGLTTNHCVSTTTRMAGNLDYNTILIADATATFDRTGINGDFFTAEVIHRTSLASLNGEFAEVISTEELLSRV